MALKKPRRLKLPGLILLSAALVGCGSAPSVVGRLPEVGGLETMFPVTERGSAIDEPACVPSVIESVRGLESGPVLATLETGSSAVIRIKAPAEDERLTLASISSSLSPFESCDVFESEEKNALSGPGARRLRHGFIGLRAAMQAPAALERRSPYGLPFLQEKEAVASDRFVEFGALELRHVKFPFYEPSEKRNDLTERTVPQMNRPMVTLLVGREPLLEVEDFEPAKARLDDWYFQRKLILLPYSERGRAKFADWNENNIGEQIGLFFDGVLIVMPRVEAKFEVIDYFAIGNLLEEEAEEILSKLRKLASN
jgi:hypothetical protein